jgi:outer membrane protein TolC
LRRRPDIAASEQQLAAADHALDAARDAFMPDFQLAATGGLVGSNLVPGSPFAIWSLGGSILAPIFSAGRLEAQQDAATARRDQAAFAYRRTALTAFKEVEDSLSAVQRNEEQVKALAAERDSEQHALVLATHRYREGYSPYLDQLDAERGLLSAQLSLVQARTDQLNAIVTLYQSLGGGWRPQ